MILADKIIDERKRLGLSQEELAEKLGVSRQAVSKWESTQSTPDLQKILQLADLFEVSIDYLLKDEIEIDRRADEQTECQNDTSMRKISMEEANAFLSLREEGSRLISLGVAFCILSPVLLIVLTGSVDEAGIDMSMKLASATGMLALFALVAGAVGLFVYYGTKNEKFEKLDKIDFETAYGVDGMAKEKRHNYEPIYLRGLVVGIVLCVLASLPLIIAGCLEVPDFVCTWLTGLLLVMVAIGVALIIRVSMVKESFDILLHEKRK